MPKPLTSKLSWGADADEGQGFCSPRTRASAQPAAGIVAALLAESARRQQWTRASAQPAAGVAAALLAESARRQQWMTSQAEAFLQSSREQYTHLEEALRLCMLQQAGLSQSGMATMKLPEEPSLVVAPRESKWAASVQQVASPKLCCPETVEDATLKPQELKEEEINWSQETSRADLDEDYGQHSRHISTAVSDLIGVKGWNRLFESEGTPSAPISEKRRSALRRQEAFLQRLVRSRQFDIGIGLLVLANSAFIGFQVEYGDDERHATLFLAGSIVFCALFLAEMGMRILGEGRLFCVQNTLWNVFDAVVITSSVTELCLRLAVGESRGSQNTSIFRTLRVLRFIRVARVLRVMRVFRELRMMIFSIMHSLHSIVWAMGLLLVFTFIFGITFTQGVRDALQDESVQLQPASQELVIQRFGSLDRTILTLIQAVLGGISWAELSDKLKEVHWGYEMLFFAFEALTVLALLNIVTGVFVDGAMRSASQDREMVMHDQMSQDGAYAQELRGLFVEADLDRTGHLSLHQFLDYVQDDRVQSYLRAMDIHISEAKSLFHLLDIDDSGTVTVDEFIAGCLRFKGEAKGVDVLTLMYENKRMVGTIIGALETMGRDLQVLRLSSMALQGQGQRPQRYSGSELRGRRMTVNGPAS